MRCLTSFWRLLEQRPSRAAVMAEWIAVAGDALPAIQPLLRPVARCATAYPDDRSPGRLLKVVQHRDGMVVAIDEQDWQHRLALAPDDVVLHELDLKKLRAALCAALSCVNASRTPVDHATNILQIGNWEPQKAASFPVYLLLCSTRTLLRTTILDRAAAVQKPGAILLTPTRTHWDDEIEALARASKLLLVSAREIVEVASGGFRETPAWEEYLQAFAQMVKLTLPGNYRNKKPAPMRGTRAANIEKLEKELEKHLLAARDHAHSLRDSGLEPALLPRPAQKDLAARAGLTEYDVSRCLGDRRAKVLKILWGTADSLEDVMKYQRRR
jgi:hypothetical protein